MLGGDIFLVQKFNLKEQQEILILFIYCSMFIFRQFMMSRGAMTPMPPP